MNQVPRNQVSVPIAFSMTISLDHMIQEASEKIIDHMEANEVGYDDHVSKIAQAIYSAEMNGEIQRRVKNLVDEIVNSIVQEDQIIKIVRKELASAAKKAVTEALKDK